MNKQTAIQRHAVRITCMAHTRLTARINRFLARPELIESMVLIESARCMRQRMNHRFWAPGGLRVNLDESPMDIFRTTVQPGTAREIIEGLVDTAELHTPGHGMLYAQEVIEHFKEPLGQAKQPPSSAIPGMINDLALLTCILSMTGSGNNIARIALKLGACVPVISRGVGSGIRDRMGLLRITIPPEKEIVRLIIPAQDAGAIRRLIIEEGRMARPGGGFLYESNIHSGLVDPMINIGRQTHAASIEQIIAALDEVKAGTTWRRRFTGLHEGLQDSDLNINHNQLEITFHCPEGRAKDLVQAAMSAGAGGATVNRVRRLGNGGRNDRGAAWESGVMCIPKDSGDTVIQALLNESQPDDGPVQTLAAPVVFSHNRPS